MIRVSPLIPGIIPFALMSGAFPVEAGMSAGMSIAMSIFIFAGASQLAIAQLVGENTGYAAILLAALVINLRFAMYSASLAPHFSELGRLPRLMSPYILTDQGYALSVSYYQDDQTSQSKLWYYLGVSIPLWLIWQVGTLVGALAGAAIPPEWSLDFAIPLVFLSLIVPAIKDRSMLLAAIVSGVIATALYPVSSSSAVLFGALSGVISGYLFDRIYGGGISV